MSKKEAKKNNIMDIQKIISNYHNASASRKAEIRKNLEIESKIRTGKGIYVVIKNSK